ncbi:MAG: FtsX-like permease family protein [Bacteroidota bacterium]
MHLPALFARRYLVSKKSTQSINILSGISVLGMLVGSMGLILVLSVFNGFEDLVLNLYNKFYPELIISPAKGKFFNEKTIHWDELNRVEGINAYSMQLEEKALLRYGDNQYIATVRGVDSNFTRVSSVQNSMFHGQFQLKNNNADFAIVGAGIEQALELNYDNPFNDLTIYIPKKGVSYVLNPEEAFNRQIIQPLGSFSIQQEFDLEYVFVPLSFMRTLLNAPEDVSAVSISLKPGANIYSVKSALKKICGNNFEVLDRYEQNKTLYAVMRVEKWVVYAVLTFILIVAAFNIIGSLSMLIIDKRKDINILRVMGADLPSIKRIFLYEGVLLSFIGCIFGFIFSVILILLQQKFGFIEIGGGTFVVNSYPVKMQVMDFVLVFFTVMGIGIIASWIPMMRKMNSPTRLSFE